MRSRPEFARTAIYRSLAQVCLVTIVLLGLAIDDHGQSCQTSGELDDAPRNAITTVGQRLFEMAAKGDTASLRQNATADSAADFSGVEQAVKDYQPDLTGAQTSVRSLFLLEAEGQVPIPNAEFYCGVFGKNGQTPGSAEIFLANLRPGKYAVIVLDAISSKAKDTFSLFLQQEGTEWKLASLYIKPAQVAGRDSDWFLAQARQYKAKGELHNAWFFYLLARNMVSPAPFMSTLATDKLGPEFESARPVDLPGGGKTADLLASGVTYRMTAMFPQAVGNDLDLIVKYQSADASNNSQAYQSNLSLIKALVAKYPELREAFVAIVARDQDNNGHDYGTLLAMKDIK